MQKVLSIGIFTPKEAGKHKLRQQVHMALLAAAKLMLMLATKKLSAQAADTGANGLQLVINE